MVVPWRMAKKRKHGKGSRPPKVPAGRSAAARQQAATTAGQRRLEAVADRKARRVAEQAAAEQAARESRAAERAAEEAARAERAAAEADSPLPRGKKLPAGWLERSPDLDDSATPPGCAARRERLLAWMADGLDLVHVADGTDPDEADYEACWQGRVVRVHRRAFHAARAVLDAATRHGRRHGLEIEPVPRPAVKLADDSMRRVVVCRCSHEHRDPSTAAAPMFEARSPSTNAALEYAGSGYGYICPAAAFLGEMRRRGFHPGTDQSGPAWEIIAPGAMTRLGLGGDPARDRPVYVPDIVYGSGGGLLAVRPRRPGPRARRPSVGATIEHLDSRPDGVSVDEFAAHFGVSANTTRRVIDEINPELVYAGSPRRCVRRRGTTSRYVFAISSDRAEIDASFREYGRPGREIEPEIVAHRPTGLIVGLGMKRVW